MVGKGKQPEPRNTFITLQSFLPAEFNGAANLNFNVLSGLKESRKTASTNTHACSPPFPSKMGNFHFNDIHSLLECRLE
jgi:hypothetical protein